MLIRKTLSAVVAALALTIPAAAVQAQETAPTEKWQSVARTDNQEAFVNTSSIKTVNGQPEARVKQNFAQPQPSAKKDKSYLSTRSTYRFDCAQRRVGMKELRAYAAADLKGDVVQKATSSDKNLMWVDAQKATVFGEVLDYVCGRMPGG